MTGDFSHDFDFYVCKGYIQLLTIFRITLESYILNKVNCLAVRNTWMNYFTCISTSRDVCLFICRPIFMYRGDTLFKVRYGHYKAHFYTWGTPLDAQVLVSKTHTV